MKNIKITHFIYDMDGLLLDTEPFYTIVTQEIVGKYGKTFDWNLKAKMMGRPSKESAITLIEELQLPFTAEEYLIKREELLLKILPTACLKKGAEEIVEKARKNGIIQAVATSSTQGYFNIKTQKHTKWFSKFKVIVKGDDPELNKGKPAPDIFLLTAKRMNVNPKQCIVFEDSPAGVEAGIAAGMKVVAVPDPNLEKENFNKAHLILNSLDEFKVTELI